MASLSQLSAALIHAAQENTVALANFKFDFAIIKCEPPEEYRAVGECLSRNRKENAEDGPFHITARKLGADTSHHIRLSDPLLSPGGVVTIGLQNKHTGTEDGIYWSLPLATLQFYGHPVLSTGHTGLRNSQVVFKQFLCVVLGAVIQSWGWTKPDITLPLELLLMLDWSTDKICNRFPVPRWLKVLTATTQRYMAASGTEKDHMSQLIVFGRRRSSNIIASDTEMPRVFGLTALPPWLSTLTKKTSLSKDGKMVKEYSQVIRFLQLWAREAPSKLNLEHAVILSLDGENGVLSATNLLAKETNRKKRKKTLGSESNGGQASRGSWVVWSLGYNFRSYDRTTNPRNSALVEIVENGTITGDDLYLERQDGQNLKHRFLCGNGTTAVYVPYSGSSIASELELSKNRMGIKHLFACLKNGLLNKSQIAATIYAEESEAEHRYLSRLDMFAIAELIYSSLPGSRVDLNVTSAWREPCWWKTFSNFRIEFPWRSEAKELFSWKTFQEFFDTGISRSIIFSCIAHFDTGHLDLPPAQLKGAMAISNQNSIYIADTLLLDQSKAWTTCGIRRITGNIGKPGLSILIPPSNPKIREPSCDTWRVANEPFDGTLQDSFSGTSLHLSLTGYELPLDSGRHGLRDSECMFVETAVSLFDRGEWVADLDLLTAAEIWQKGCSQGPCTIHTAEEQSDTCRIRSLLCLDSWLSLLESPPSHSIVRAHQNPGARLAATCLALQKKYDFHILQSEPCWTCVDNMVRGPRQKKGQGVSTEENAKVNQVSDVQPEESDTECEDSSDSESAESFPGDVESLEPLFQDAIMQGVDPSVMIPLGDESSESDSGEFVTGRVFIC